MARAAWYDDVRHAYPDVVGPLTEQGTVPEALYYELRVALGEDPLIDLVHGVEVGEEKRFLLVRGDTAQLLNLEPPSTTEIVSLGDLTGGKLTERITPIEKGLEIELEYEHERLGEEVLRARFPYYEAGGGLFLGDRVERAGQLGRKLRDTLSRWSQGKAAD
jgi:hypothetical protein